MTLSIFCNLKYRYAVCHDYFNVVLTVIILCVIVLSVIMMSFIMLSVTMLSFIMLCAVIPNVFMLSVEAPSTEYPTVSNGFEKSQCK